MYQQLKITVMSRPGRDDARERIKKAAPSHTANAHKMESEKNKKSNADLKTDRKKGKQK
ncbi:MAG: hypothetical protein V4635_14755 [Bacteroidota bacterium]